MANIAATFTSGLVLGFGAVCAFTAHFSEEAHLINYRLKRASAELANVAAGTNTPLPTWKDTQPEIMSMYQRLAARVSGNAVPLAKTKWNHSIAAAASSLAQLDIDADRLAAAFHTKQ
ncbi:hypothetical protein H4R23_002220 [Coemansia sp. Cherry 401B]|nr:hypothetical protein IWW54_005260 [Coemansia sp. RSA 2705]KAJ2735347.1 hypothetical protein H4R23_002220 [Coemansia sp. Cherry 401B]